MADIDLAKENHSDFFYYELLCGFKSLDCECRKTLIVANIQTVYERVGKILCV